MHADQRQHRQFWMGLPPNPRRNWGRQKHPQPWRSKALDTVPSTSPVPSSAPGTHSHDYPIIISSVSQQQMGGMSG